MKDLDQPIRVRNRYGRFAQVPEKLVLDPTVSDRAIRVYALLWTFSNKNGRKAWPSRQTMADTLKVTTRTIDRGIRELEDLGALAVESNFKGERQTNNVYTILVLPEPAPESRKVIHRGDKFVTPQLSTGVTQMSPSGATNLSPQEQEPQEQESYSPVPDVADGPQMVQSETGQNNHDPIELRSRTHGKPLSAKDVFASVGHKLPTTFDDVALERLGAEILSRAASRVLDPTAYVISTIRGWHRPNYTGADLVDRGEWIERIDQIDRDRQDERYGAAAAGGRF